MRALLCSLTVVACLYCPATDAADSPWRRFENSSFIAYSNGSDEHVANILEALEQFQAAAMQIPSFVIPANRPKTMVILPATREEFLTLAQFDTIAGFATTLNGQPTIVLPADQANIDIRVVVGHEFAHTLLFNEHFDYPSWYAEGFAEIASSIVIDERESTFEIGARDDLRQRAARPAVRWNELISETFNPHALGDIDVAASTYAQDWLLVHFLTLNESADYASELNRYFANIINGQASEVAFAEAFGKSVAEIGRDELPGYLRSITNRRFAFDPSLMDTDFRVSAAVDDEFVPVLRFLRDYADVQHGRNAPPEPVPYLAGQWDWLRLNDQCTDPVSFVLDEAHDLLTLEAFYSDHGTDPVPALFSIEVDEDGKVLLTNITASRYPQVRMASDYEAVIKSENAMCFDVQPSHRNCLRVMQRCD